MIKLKGITRKEPINSDGDKNERKEGDRDDTKVTIPGINQMMTYQEKGSRHEGGWNILGL